MKKFVIAGLSVTLFIIIGLIIFQFTRDEEESTSDVSVAESFYSVCCVDGNSNDCESFSDVRYTCIPGGECTDRGPGSQACPANRPVLVASGTTCTPENTYWGQWSECVASAESCTRTRSCLGEASCGGVDVCGGQTQQTEACPAELCAIEQEEAQVAEPISPEANTTIDTNQNNITCNPGQMLDSDGTCKNVAGECSACGGSETICSSGLSCTSGVCQRSNASSNCFAVSNYK